VHQNGKPDLIFFTNIPTPYRSSFYEELGRQGVNFKVFYMRETEADRNWQIDQGRLKYPFYIDRGFYRMIGRFHVHFNPRLLMKLWRARAGGIVIGGAWNDLDVLLLVLAKRLRLVKSKLHFWSEANYLTIGARNDNKLKSVVRRFVLNSSDGAQLRSGHMTEITLQKWRIKVNAFVDLPNTIEEGEFQISATEVEARYRNEIPVFLIPARLDEKIKGIINFFQSIGDENIRRGQFLVAGEGPDKPAIQSFIQTHGLEENIKLLGFCDTEQMVSLYKKANVFVLPSFSDPCPLSLVEALRMKLPVLVSERCGNHFEAVSVETDGNGFVFDPSRPEEIRAAFEALMERNEEWREMGNESGRRYDLLYGRSVVVERFIKQMAAFA